MIQDLYLKIKKQYLFIFFVIITFIISYYLYNSGFYYIKNKIPLADVFGEEEQHASKEILSIYITFKSIQIEFTYRDERNITIYSDSNYLTHRIYFDDRVRLPLDGYCKDHVGTFELLIHSKLSDSTFKKEIHCKASLVEEVSFCLKEPFNYRCAKVFSKVFSFFFFIVIVLILVTLIYLILYFFYKIYYLFVLSSRLPNLMFVEEFDKRISQLEFSKKENIKYLNNTDNTGENKNDVNSPNFTGENSSINNNDVSKLVTNNDILKNQIEEIENKLQIFSEQIQTINQYSQSHNNPINGTNHFQDITDSVQRLYSELGSVKASILSNQQRIFRLETMLSAVEQTCMLNKRTLGKIEASLPSTPPSFSFSQNPPNSYSFQNENEDYES